MANITPTLSTLLVDVHSSQPIPRSSTALQAHLDDFLKEAYRLNRHISSLVEYLRGIRQPYLSTAPPSRRNPRGQSEQQTTGTQTIPTHLTDKQREEIDTETSNVLRDLSSSITNLSTAASLKHDTDTKQLQKKYGKPNSALWRWAAGDDGLDADAGKSDVQVFAEGTVKTRKLFRDSVIWYLSKYLERAVKTQQDMIEIRVEREQQKRMSVLYDQKNKNIKLKQDFDNTIPFTTESPALRYGTGDLRAHDTYNPALADSANQTYVAGLSPEQLQLFEEENASLLLHYNDTLTKVTEAEKSLLEISSLQQTLVGHLTVQGEMIEQLVEDAEKTDENVRRGNKELKKASERGSTARLVCYSTVGLCAFLITWDLIF